MAKREKIRLDEKKTTPIATLCTMNRCSKMINEARNYRFIYAQCSVYLLAAIRGGGDEYPEAKDEGESGMHQ